VGAASHRLEERARALGPKLRNPRCLDFHGDVIRLRGKFL
jgi:hypothetical protein